MLDTFHNLPVPLLLLENEEHSSCVTCLFCEQMSYSMQNIPNQNWAWNIANSHPMLSAVPGASPAPETYPAAARSLLTSHSPWVCKSPDGGGCLAYPARTAVPSVLFPPQSAINNKYLLNWIQVIFFQFSISVFLWIITHRKLPGPMVPHVCVSSYIEKLRPSGTTWQ